MGLQDQAAEFGEWYNGSFQYEQDKVLTNAPAPEQTEQQKQDLNTYQNAINNFTNETVKPAANAAGLVVPEVALPFLINDLKNSVEQQGLGKTIGDFTGYNAVKYAIENPDEFKEKLLTQPLTTTAELLPVIFAGRFAYKGGKHFFEKSPTDITYTNSGLTSQDKRNGYTLEERWGVKYRVKRSTKELHPQDELKFQRRLKDVQNVIDEMNANLSVALDDLIGNPNQKNIKITQTEGKFTQGSNNTGKLSGSLEGSSKAGLFSGKLYASAGTDIDPLLQGPKGPEKPSIQLQDTFKMSSSSTELSNAEKAPQPTIYARVTSASGGLTPEQMNANAIRMYQILRDQGWSLQSIAAVLGNMETESGLNPGAWEVKNQPYPDENGNGGGYGLVQWTAAGDKFLKWAGNELNKGRELSADEVNDMAINEPEKLLKSELKYLSYTMQPGNGEWFQSEGRPYMTSKEFIKSIDDPGNLAKVFTDSYERPNAKYAKYEERAKNAQKWYHFVLNFSTNGQN